MNDRQREEISATAYGLWETEGKPDGKALEHWHRAELMGIHKTISENMPSTPAVPSPEDYG